MGLTRAFATYLSKKINEHFPPSEKSGEPTAEPEALYVALNAVKDPSFVRVEAGELKERSGPFFLLLFFFSRRFFFFRGERKAKKPHLFSLSLPPPLFLSLPNQKHQTSSPTLSTSSSASRSRPRCCGGRSRSMTSPESGTRRCGRALDAPLPLTTGGSTASRTCEF